MGPVELERRRIRIYNMVEKVLTKSPDYVKPTPLRQWTGQCLTPVRRGFFSLD